eukprot:evm.model.NODE_21393_length_6280_cov_46.926750.1
MSLSNSLLSSVPKDLICLGVGNEAFIVDGASRLELQRLSNGRGKRKQQQQQQQQQQHQQQLTAEEEEEAAGAVAEAVAEEEEERDDAVVGVAWGDRQGVLAALWESGTLAIAENPTATGAWSVVSWFHIRSAEEEYEREEKGCGGATEGAEKEKEKGKRKRRGPLIPS